MDIICKDDDKIDIILKDADSITKTGINRIEFESSFNPYFWFHNLGNNVVYVSANPEPTVGGDGVSALIGGGITCLETTNNEIYILGSGTVEIHRTDSKLCPFKNAPVSSGGGGSAVDAYTKTESDARYAQKSDIPTSLPADGGNADTVENSTISEIISKSRTAVFLSDRDLNELIIDGSKSGLAEEYYSPSNASAGSCTNRPITSAGPFRLYVFGIRAISPTDYICGQIYISYDMAIYMRKCITGTWGDWYRCLNPDSVNELSGVIVFTAQNMSNLKIDNSVKRVCNANTFAGTTGYTECGIWFKNTQSDPVTFAAVVHSNDAAVTAQIGYGRGTMHQQFGSGAGRAWFSNTANLTSPTLLTMNVPSGNIGYIAFNKTSSTSYAVIDDISVFSENFT